jgi:(E)-4-hydroxy-3-methylbut-2-enyl-diphosphate synthase
MENQVFFDRRPTNRVNVGGICMGNEFPVRIQSMTNTLTADIQGSVVQCIGIIKAGADYVRLTVPSMADIQAFDQIRKRLRHEGYHTPLIADVHFNPEIAIGVASVADKVRINPGNFGSPENMIRLIEVCRKHGTVIRIGVNHGSLSEAMMDKYGDTPEGMAESAMEFLRICTEQNFDQVVVSMKSSNVRVMVYATRLVADMMLKEGIKFPLHLGVTEAGEGEDGRIKSAVGISTLLAEGIGDTIRVSLTEDPEAEIPVARKLVSISENMSNADEWIKIENPSYRYSFIKRYSRKTGNIGGNNFPLVIGFDAIDSVVHFVDATYDKINNAWLQDLHNDPNAVIVYSPSKNNIPSELKWLRKCLDNAGCAVPVVFRLNLYEESAEDVLLKSASWLGGSFIDGFGDGIWLTNKLPVGKNYCDTIALGILQACRARISKTEFISCPSCGRTHFNLMETIARIKAATSHLKGLKIGVMGCIVNGPGEMADADYGYVGAGKGKITLYKARQVVKKGIPESDAVQELINLIKENNDWIEK